MKHMIPHSHNHEALGKIINKLFKKHIGPCKRWGITRMSTLFRVFNLVLHS